MESIRQITLTIWIEGENKLLQGRKAMKNDSEGTWDRSRWQELIEWQKNFVIDSELIMDSKRNELLFESNNLIKDCGLEEYVVSLLCMLGKSIVIVPKN